LFIVAETIFDCRENSHDIKITVTRSLQAQNRTFNDALAMAVSGRSQVSWHPAVSSSQAGGPTARRAHRFTLP
jgi:hypothetical protein